MLFNSHLVLQHLLCLFPSDILTVLLQKDADLISLAFYWKTWRPYITWITFGTSYA